TGWLVFDVVRRQVGREAGALLAAMFLSAPLTFWVVFVMFEDALVTLFITAAVVMLMLTWRAPGQKDMALVALAVSAAIATKLQGLLLSIPIVVLVAVNLFRAGSLRDACLQMAVPVLAIGIVPYAVAWFRTGNPLFPFYNAVFRSALFAPINLVDRRWMGKGSADLLYAMTFHTARFMEGVDGGFGFQHVLLVPSVLVAVLLIRRSEVVIPAFCGAAMFLISIVFTQYARYLYPTFPLLAIASAAVWTRAVMERWRPLLVCCLCGLVA